MINLFENASSELTSFVHSFIYLYSIDHTDVEFVIRYKYKYKQFVINIGINKHQLYTNTISDRKSMSSWDMSSDISLHLHCQQVKGISQNRTVLVKDIIQNFGSSISPNHMLWNHTAVIRTSWSWFLLRFIPHEAMELNLERHTAKQALQLAY